MKIKITRALSSLRSPGIGALHITLALALAQGGCGGASEESTGGASDDCPTASFADVSSSPETTLKVSCSGDYLVVESNGIPPHEVQMVTPNEISTQSLSWKIPRSPAKAATNTEIPLGGPVAIAVDGMPIFGPTEAPNDGYRDPVVDNLLDYCLGHVAPGGMYHYHARPDCLIKENGKPKIVVGYSFDGYPILAPYECADDACSSVKKLRSSFVSNGGTGNAWEANDYMEGQGDLDECNGKTDSDGIYHYYATDEFPYFMGCYRGTPLSQGSGMPSGGMPPPGGMPPGG